MSPSGFRHVFDDWKQQVKAKLRFSDTALDKAIRFSKGAELWCKSGIAFWGAGVALGAGSLALHAVGIPLPLVLGTSTIITSAAMCAKSVVLDRVFHVLYERGMEEREARYKAKNIPAPDLPLFSFKKFPKAKEIFKIKASPCMKELMQKPLVAKTRANLKTAMANANSRLRL